ncbi:hypothetical protein ARMGADRAFT_43255 [Armillaria gallica]|uniref:Uncharacterized protein n=1 Tax=Armillaria gallica TaxID=47427 RepID=A0A2H3F0I7_ARMGA|nr:hypothetical protein ARMGADRAFT_43255 [Armillaria gallica]
MCYSSSCSSSSSAMVCYQTGIESSSKSFAQETTTPINQAGGSSPQCCHCGWRGAHAPNCPFK